MSANAYMLDTLARRTWGFDGYVTSDCGAIRDVHASHQWVPDGWDHAVSPAEATALCIQAGTDLNCGGEYASQAINAVNEGVLSEDDMDVALVRLFTSRMKTGEFDPAENVLTHRKSIPGQIRSQQRIIQKWQHRLLMKRS